VVLVEELQRLGVEVIFVNRELGRSPEDDLRLPVHGMMAEDERAKLVERHRRGKRQAARAGTVHVRRGAPSAYRDVPKHDGGGHARDAMIADAAPGVRQVFDGIGPDRAPIGEVCRRLTCADAVSRTGKTVWDRSAGWGRRKNPAYLGRAAFGKTRQGPRRPRVRAQRGRPLPPRRAVSSVEVPQEEWRAIPGPVISAAEVFTAVQEPWRAHQRQARQSRRGARSLLQGVGPCSQGGDAFYGKPLSRKATKGKPRADADYRCLGTDAYRCGGEPVWGKTQGRTELRDLAVGREVGRVLAPPERLAEESRRRLQPQAPARRTTLATVEAQLSQGRQGLARLLDSSAEGLIEKQEFAPRSSPHRHRLTPLEAQAQHAADAALRATELRLIIGRRADFAANVPDGLEAAEWTSKRAMSRALGQRVDGASDPVQGGFRVDQRPGDPGSEQTRDDGPVQRRDPLPVPRAPPEVRRAGRPEYSRRLD
jgi:site-specific DNA recombinase